MPRETDVESHVPIPGCVEVQPDRIGCDTMAAMQSDMTQQQTAGSEISKRSVAIAHAREFDIGRQFGDPQSQAGGRSPIPCTLRMPPEPSPTVPVVYEQQAELSQIIQTLNA